MLVKEVSLYLFKEAFVISAGSVLADKNIVNHPQNQETPLAIATVRHIVLQLVFKQLLHQGLKFIDILFRKSPHVKITIVGIPLFIGNSHL